VTAPPDPSPVFDPRTYEQGVPYDLLAELRARSAVTWMEEPAVLGWPAGPGFWAVWRHAEVKAVLREAARFSSARGTQIRDPARAEDLAYITRQMLNQDPPDHTRLRGLVSKAFTPRAVARLEERIRQHCRGLVSQMWERLGDGEEVDFAQAAADLPLFTLAEVLGLPEGDRYLLYDWSNRVIGYQDEEYSDSAAFDPGSSGASPMARAAAALRPVLGPDGRLPNPRSKDGMPDLYLYAHELAGWKRAHPSEDVMSLLLTAEDEGGGGITTEEFENMFWLFAVAGNETLRNGIPGGMYSLLIHPEDHERLRSDPSLLQSAVEEMLRWWPPVMHFRRTATCDTEIGGQPVRAGDKVVVFHVAANRDPAVFPDPDRFDVGRRPNDHVSFGFGVHFCLGAHLARTQMRSLFGELCRRERLEQSGPLARLRSNFQNGVKHLPVRLAR
jgi:cytochrome P450